MKSEIVFAIYKPHENNEHELKELISKHVPILKTHNLITDRKPILVQSKNGNYIEIFEWKSNDALEEAHKNPEVQKLWGEMENGGYEALLWFLPRIRSTTCVPA